MLDVTLLYSYTQRVLRGAITRSTRITALCDATTRKVSCLPLLLLLLLAAAGNNFATPHTTRVCVREGPRGNFQ